MFRIRQLRLYLCILLLGSLPLWGQASDDLAKAWEKASSLQSDEAHADFNRLEKTEPRAAWYGQAMTWLQAQPKTEANIQKAISLLTKVVQENPSDDEGLASQYYLARIAEAHHADIGYDSIDGRMHEAEGLYQKLFQGAPGTLWAELALTRYAELLYYQNEPIEKKPARLAEAESLLSQIKTAWVLSLYHFNLSNAYARLEISEPKALDHLVIAEDLGIPIRPTRVDALVRIIKWAQLQGKPEIALKYGEIYLRDFPRDDRSYEIELLVASLKPPITVHS